jgi:hypothetical protein
MSPVAQDHQGGPRIALVLPTESLWRQVSAWACKTRVEVRLCTSPRAADLHEMLRTCRATVIDATAQPGAAADALGAVWGAPGHLVVYTEHMHPGLELFCRTRGALLVTGPMEPDEWEDVLAPAPPRPGTPAQDPPGLSEAPRRRQGSLRVHTG